MPGLVLQLQANCPPGRLGDWLTAHDIPFDVERLWEKGNLRSMVGLEGVSFLVVLGSSHSVNDTEPGWILEVIATIRKAVAENIPVLGICFGSQALAVALGGTVSRMRNAEIYWAKTATCGLVPKGPWIVWHHDAFTVPPGAQRLGWSSSAPLAFRSGVHLGVQFHAEASAREVESWIREEHEELERLGIDTRALQGDGRRADTEAATAADELFKGWWCWCVDRLTPGVDQAVAHE